MIQGPRHGPQRNVDTDSVPGEIFELDHPPFIFVCISFDYEILRYASHMDIFKYVSYLSHIIMSLSSDP